MSPVSGTLCPASPAVCQIPSLSVVCSSSPPPLQARYLAQIVVMGAQVVGRAFARALRQEYAGIFYATVATTDGHTPHVETQYV